MITLTQSNSLPMTLVGAASFAGPPLGSGATGGVNLVAQPTAPQQVMGLTPLFPCCTKTTAGSGGCFSFVISVAGSVTQACITVEVAPPNAPAKVWRFCSPPSSPVSCHSWALEFPDVMNKIFPNLSTSLVGDITSSCTVQICTTTPDTYGTVVTLTHCSSVGTGSVTYSVGCPYTVTLGTAPSIVNTFDGDCHDCRQGHYVADTQPDDTNWTMPVFAETGGDSYHNDQTPFLLSYPKGYDPFASGDFTLQKLVANTWTTIATLNTSAYGDVFTNTWCQTNFSNRNVACSNSNFVGFLIDWQKVFNIQGTGYYKFAVQGNITPTNKYCFFSPPFCLQQWDCNAVSNTVKFEATYNGGTFGSVTNQGTTWSLCCTKTGTGGTSTCPITWYDSIRFYGFFGRENSEYQRDQIKYATGIITKVRDELIHNYELRAGGSDTTQRLPSWFHQRFSSYALMADYLYVSDYAYNNAEYAKYKKFWVVADGNYAPQYTNYSRYTKVKVNFKEGQQLVYRDRCC